MLNCVYTLKIVKKNVIQSIDKRVKIHYIKGVENMNNFTNI
jgi:hypothetical protein